MSDEPVLLSSDRNGVRTLTLNAIALAQSKALLNESADRMLRDALANEARAQAVNFATVDVSEAYAAFAERREPSFIGQWALSRSEQTHA